MPVVREGLALISAVAGAPLAAAALAARPAWRVGLSERLGWLPGLEPGSVWLHGASVGESRLVAPLAAALELGGRSVFTSAQTAPGREALGRARPGAPRGLAPRDHPWCVERALDRVRPAAIVMCETEIWPCWIGAAARRRVPVGIVSGRLSDRSLRGYRLIRPVIARTLARLTAVGARTRSDADRFVALGADPHRVSVTGDLKLAAPPEPPVVADDLRAALSGRTVIAAGSTHPGEEAVVLEAFDRVERDEPSVTLVLAPRHPDRVGSLEERVASAGRPVRRRTQLAGVALAPREVLLLDSLGDLAGLYGVARAAFVGGSLVPKVGGHDPLEAVRQGRAVAIGPRHDAARETVAALVDAGVAFVVSDAETLARAWQSQLSRPAADVRRAAAHVLEPGVATLERSLALVETLLDGRAA